MPTMDEVLRAGGIVGADADHLHRLVADWQLLADLSFADLLLFVPHGAAGEFVAVAQMRPTTGPTAYTDDLVGARATAADRPQLAIAVADARIVREGDPVWVAGDPVREEAIPVCHDGKVVAVVARNTNLAAARTPSRLEIAYLRSANDLAQMLAEGRWPYASYDVTDPSAAMRVGDGLIRLDADGTVAYASPNALSAYRRLGHLGDLEGNRLDAVTAALAGRSALAVESSIVAVARGRAPLSGELEARDVVLALRALPLRPAGEHIGALVLVHDVTELRRRERQLMGKDATIREIHHRVKNNLQTVAALLRLQARRLAVPEARAALEESVRRVSSIAVVHETLSGTLDEAVNFDGVADRIAAMVTEVTATPGAGAVTVRRTGTFGVLPAEVATPLAMVLTELLQNAAEHGFAGLDQPGEVEIVVARGSGAHGGGGGGGDGGGAGGGGELAMSVRDNGRGLPADFRLDGSDRLGLQIVRTLVESELGGSLEIGAAAGGGTVASVRLRDPGS